MVWQAQKNRNAPVRHSNELMDSPWLGFIVEDLMVLSPSEMTNVKGGVWVPIRDTGVEWNWQVNSMPDIVFPFQSLFCICFLAL